MSDSNPPKRSDIGPENLTKIRLTPPQDYSAGLPAVKVALDHIRKEVGLPKGLQTLSKMNQKEGFDCPDVPGRILLSPPNLANTVKTERKL